MDKINEALEAGRSKSIQGGLDNPVVVPVPGGDSKKTPDLELEEEMTGLYQTIDSMLSDSPKKVIQFIGSKGGEGTSTITREFGKVASGKFGKSVLLLDTDPQKTSQLLFFDIKSGYSLEESYRNGEPIDKALCQVGVSSLFVVRTFSKPLSSTLEDYDSLNEGDIWNNLKQRFDLILIDSPPANISPSSLAFSRKMDGVVLVLEAEKTRWQVVESVKEKIIKNGGKILGVVLNKRKYYIPKFIYKGL